MHLASHTQYVSTWAAHLTSSRLMARVTARHQLVLGVSSVPKRTLTWPSKCSMPASESNRFPYSSILLTKAPRPQNPLDGGRALINHLVYVVHKVPSLAHAGSTPAMLPLS